MFDEQTKAAVRRFASEMDVEVEALLAVAEVESGGRPSARVDGRDMPLIRWEGHYFHRRLDPDQLARALEPPPIASPHAFPHPERIKNPADQQGRYDILKRGKAIDAEAAVESCSWGVGQVMGANWEWLGYESAEALEARACESVVGQIELMARFIAKRGLADEMARHDWAAFARSYNGPGFRSNRYDEKMAEAYERLAGRPARRDEPAERHLLKMGAQGAEVFELQTKLRKLGYALTADGDFGPATRREVIRFQADYALLADGIVGRKTWSLLDSLQGRDAAAEAEPELETKCDARTQQETIAERFGT